MKLFLFMVLQIFIALKKKSPVKSVLARFCMQNISDGGLKIRIKLRRLS